MTGAQIDENGIFLHFQDGQRGDDDLNEGNGRIIDLGGPGFIFEDLDDNESGNEASFSKNDEGRCFLATMLKTLFLSFY